MKITIIGGSQGTGAELAKAALVGGHDVTVLSRSGKAPAGAAVITGSAADFGAAREAVDGADAVVVTVGGAKGVKHHRARVTKTVVEAMKDSGVRRIVVQSALGAGNSASQLSFPLNYLAKVVLAFPLADHDKQESIVRASGLDWTVVRPTGLTSKGSTGRWRALRETEEGTLAKSISRADLGAYLMQILDDESTFGQAIGISGR